MARRLGRQAVNGDPSRRPPIVYGDGIPLNGYRPNDDFQNATQSRRRPSPPMRNKPRCFPPQETQELGHLNRYAAPDLESQTAKSHDESTLSGSEFPEESISNTELHERDHMSPATGIAVPAETHEIKERKGPDERVSAGPQDIMSPPRAYIPEDVPNLSPHY